MFNIPNLLTATNLMCGILAIIMAFFGRIDLAPYALFLAGICDFLDGFAARLLNQKSELGKQLDSLADMVSFGVAPGVIMMVVCVAAIYPEDAAFTSSFSEYVHFSFINWGNSLFFGVPNSMDASIKYLPFMALVIPFFSLFRLAKFNIDTRQEDRFIGLPTPLNTVFFMFFPLAMLESFHVWKSDAISFSVVFDPYVMCSIMVGMSFLLVSEIKLISLKFKQFNWKENVYRYSFLLISIGLIPVLMVWSIPIIVFLYVLISMIENIKSKNRINEIQS